MTASLDRMVMTYLRGHGIDVLVGGAGDDTIIGGTGHDAFNGGSGSDLFVMHLSVGNSASIRDFEEGIVKLAFHHPDVMSAQEAYDHFTVDAVQLGQNVKL